MKRILRFFSTKNLVEELKQRDEVQTTHVETYSDQILYVDGPATALVIPEEGGWHD